MAKTTPKASIDSVAPATEQAAAPTPAATIESSTTPRVHEQHWAAIIGGILLVIVIGAIAFWVLNDSSDISSDGMTAGTSSEASDSATPTSAPTTSPATIKSTSQLESASSDLDATNLDSIDSDLTKNDSDAANF